MELEEVTEEDYNYQYITDNLIDSGRGLLLVFAINDANSFQFLKEKGESFIKKKGKKWRNLSLVLVGCKQDLESERKVNFSDAKALADSWGCEYIETSAKLNFNCNEAFEKLVILILNKKNHSNNKNDRHCCCCNIF